MLLRNDCRRNQHCEWLCDLVPWNTQGSRSWVRVCELLAYGHSSPRLPFMVPYPDRGMVWCSSRSVFQCRLICAMSLPCPAECAASSCCFYFGFTALARFPLHHTLATSGTVYHTEDCHVQVHMVPLKHYIATYGPHKRLERTSGATTLAVYNLLHMVLLDQYLR